MILAVNLKMNHTRKSTRNYVEQLATFLESNGCEHDIYLFPNASSLDIYNNLATIYIGAQNAYPAAKGAFTGEIGSEQLEELEVHTILIGHSERRGILHESQNFCAEKFHYYEALGFRIFYCIGESIDVRKQGLGAVIKNLNAQLEGIDLGYSKLVVAYEPIWAIGTGMSASLEDIKETHTALKERLNCPLLYGGSVNMANIAEILALECVDGALIGSAALDVRDFCEMIKKSKS
ncbi:MAG: triose-phosphate isomerase [Wolinella sp.]